MAGKTERIADITGMLRDAAANGLLQNEQPYQKSRLVEVLQEKPGDLNAVERFYLFRGVVESGKPVDGLDVSYSGSRRGRRYFFHNLGMPVQGAATMAADTQPEVSRRNDHPEDREHVAAHVALLMRLQSAAISLPKKIGSGREENPDMLAVVSSELPECPLPEWLKRDQRRPLLLGCEVKAAVLARLALFDAIRETRHNSRYFDQSWLLAPISPGLSAEARELGEEYDVGIISWPQGNPVDSEVLWTPSTRRGTKCMEDFFVRLDADARRRLVASLERVRTRAESLGRNHTVCEWAIRWMLAEDEQSIVRYLPDSIQACLNPDEETESSIEPQIQTWDIESFASVVVGLASKSFDTFADEDETIDAHLQKLGLRAFFRKRAHARLCGKVLDKIYEEFQTKVEEDDKDLSALRTFLHACSRR